MNDTVKDWLKAAPLPTLILGAYLYAYTIDSKVSAASRDAAVAIVVAQEQADRLKRIEDKVDRLTDAVAALNLATTVRLNRLEAKKEKR